MKEDIKYSSGELHHIDNDFDYFIQVKYVTTNSTKGINYVYYDSLVSVMNCTKLKNEAKKATLMSPCICQRPWNYQEDLFIIMNMIKIYSILNRMENNV